MLKLLLVVLRMISCLGQTENDERAQLCEFCWCHADGEIGAQLTSEVNIALQARLERERNSMKNLSVLSQRIHSLEDFHEWFHTEHKAYNTEDQHLFGNEDKDDPALQSY